MPSPFAATIVDYAGRLSLDRVAEIIAGADGGRGTGRDYLANTVRHLDELGIRDRLLHRLHLQVEGAPCPMPRP